MKELKNVTVDTAVELTWDNTVVTLVGTLKTNNKGEIEATKKIFGDTVKYTVVLKIADESPWAILDNKNVWIYVDGITQKKMDALNTLWADGSINGKTRLAMRGHLVKTPSTRSLNDLLNLKFIGLQPVGENKDVMSVDEIYASAMTKAQWQTIVAQRKSENAGIAAAAPVAPTAPVAPIAPF